MSQYHKIMGPFRRATEGPNRNKIIPFDWSTPEFATLAGLAWTWTEKIDGTNIRIVWDGVRPSFGGRTDNAQIPAALVDNLAKTFTEELLEQQFGAQEVVLYGEGCGPKIQKVGSLYRQEQGFVLFDIKVGDTWWLTEDKVTEIAAGLGIDRAPIVGQFSVYDAIDKVNAGLHSVFGNFYAEGIVGRPPLGLKARDGNRMLMKVKHDDLFGVDL